MTAKFGKGQILAQPTTPEGFAGTLARHPGPPGLGEPVQLPMLLSAPGRDLPTDQGRENRAARQLWKILHAARRGELRVQAALIKIGAIARRSTYLVPWEGLDANGDGVIFDSETMNATRRLLEGVQNGTLTPLNAEFTANNGGNLDYRNTFAILITFLDPL